MNNVTSISFAQPSAAKQYFESALSFETDCWDVNDALSKAKHAQDLGFVLLDVRSAELFAQGHIGGAVHFPQAN